MDVKFVESEIISEYLRIVPSVSQKLLLSANFILVNIIFMLFKNVQSSTSFYRRLGWTYVSADARLKPDAACFWTVLSAAKKQAVPGLANTKLGSIRCLIPRPVLRINVELKRRTHSTFQSFA